MDNLKSQLSHFFNHPNLLQTKTVMLLENDIFARDIFVDTKEKVRWKILDYVVLSSYESLYFECTFAYGRLFFHFLEMSILIRHIYDTSINL